jgi:hypothetical protein
MEFIKNLYNDNRVKTACWTIANAFIVIAIVALAELNAVWVPLMLALLNMATKEINKKYLS